MIVITLWDMVANFLQFPSTSLININTIFVSLHGMVCKKYAFKNYIMLEGGGWVWNYQWVMEAKGWVAKIWWKLYMNVVFQGPPLPCPVSNSKLDVHTSFQKNVWTKISADNHNECFFFSDNFVCVSSKLLYRAVTGPHHDMHDTHTYIPINWTAPWWRTEKRNYESTWKGCLCFFYFYILCMSVCLLTSFWSQCSTQEPIYNLYSWIVLVI